MDELTKELQTFLVRISYDPETISHETTHYMEHIMHLLPLNEEEEVLHYFGILGHRRISLAELAKERGMEQEALLERIDRNLRKLAVTPEWQIIRQLTYKTSAL